MSNAIRYFKALSDETRLRLTYVLERYELSVNELVSILEMGQSRVSRHLKILTEAGLLSSRRDGLWVFYSSVKEGEGAAFLKAAMPFLDEDAEMRADVEMAARIIEDRALKTRQFFNTIAEHWDTLSREVLGGFDLAGAVCDTMPEGCDTSVDLGCGTGIVLERMRGRARQIIGVDGLAEDAGAFPAAACRGGRGTRGRLAAHRGTQPPSAAGLRGGFRQHQYGVAPPVQPGECPCRNPARAAFRRAARGGGF